MSFKTVEVVLEDGRVRPSGADTLPARATALLTILGTPPPNPAEPGTLAERVAHLKGIGRGEHTDLSTDKRHLDDFGK